MVEVDISRYEKGSGFMLGLISTHLISLECITVVVGIKHTLHVYIPTKMLATRFQLFMK